MVQVRLMPASERVERPAYVWLGVVAAIITGIGAIPVGLMLISDPTGGSIGLSESWIEDSIFGSYLLPGLYLLLMNGVGMLVLAALAYRCHWTAPWLMAVLGVGLITWIAVQYLLLPETSFLQVAFFCCLFWLRQTGQLRLW